MENQTVQPKTNRRKFLRSGCIAAGAAGVVLCGGGTLAATYQPKINLVQTTLGEKNAAKRVLVVYATKAGSTAEIAARMGEILAKRGVSVDVMPAAQVKEVASYQVVVAGSAIRMGKPLPELLELLQKHQAPLQQKPCCVFAVCLTLKDDTEENRQKVNAYLDPVRALLKPAGEGVFAGVMDPARLTLLDRAIMSMRKSPSGDFRRWEQIAAWAERIPL